MADALPVLRQRLPELVERVLAQLEQPGGATAPGLQAAREAAAQLDRDGYRDRPEWRALYDGARPPQPENAEPGEWTHGWQYHASSARETTHMKRQVVPHIT